MNFALQQIRRYTQAALGIILRHPLVGTSIIPVLPDGRIVLIQRRDNGKWSLPGGMVDWGEDLPTCIRRELLEETGLTLTTITRLVGIYSEPDRDPRFHCLCVVAAAEVTGEFAIQDELEVMDVKAFAIAEIPYGQLSHDNDRQFQDYLSGSTVLS
jgi:8-oxo-dGTP diphosphatase